MPADWQILFPIWNDIIVADGKPMRQMLYLIVNVCRSCSIVADGIATFIICNGRCHNNCNCTQMVYVCLWQMLLPMCTILWQIVSH